MLPLGAFPFCGPFCQSDLKVCPEGAVKRQFGDISAAGQLKYEGNAGADKGMGDVMELLSAGQMAEMNMVSKKALRLYEQKGLLKPYRIDPDTGYRYYTHEQCSVVDAIQQMQSVGFTLAEMREILDNHDVSLMREVLERKTEELERQSYEIQMAQHTVNRLLRSCNAFESKPVFDRPVLEHMRRRRIVRFDVTPYRFEARPQPGNERLRRWELALREIKQQFIDLSIPLALFHNVGCIISRSSIESGEYECVGGFIIDERSMDDDLVTYWPEGYYLTLSIDTLFLPNGEHAEHRGMRRLIDLAHERGYRICGDYYSESILETPLFAYEGRDMMMKLFLPVDIRAARRTEGRE